MKEKSKSSLRRPDYLSEDTIAALASQAGGAISVVRLSGPDSISILESLSSVKLGTRNAREIFRTFLQDSEGKKLDDALAVFYRAPASFTGEDVVELFIHGSSFIASELLTELASRGARPALPGEFSFRAVRNGKLDLNQAQAVADLVASSNRGAVDLALEKLEGTQSRLVAKFSEELRTLASLSELGIDFADQDVEEVSLPRLKARASEVCRDLMTLEKSFERGLRLQEGVSVSFVGKPNAGKSSFFNALLGEDRSIVTEIAGTTRDIVRERLTLQGEQSSVTLRVEDTAGIRAKVSDRVEELGVGRSIDSGKRSDLVLFVVDAERVTLSPETEEREILSVWESLGKPHEKTLCILTKVDRISDEESLLAQAWAKKIFGVDVYPVSSITHRNLEAVTGAIVALCERLVARDRGEVLLTRMDQVLSVRDAIQHLQLAQSAVEESLFAADVRHALVALSPVIGVTPTDDILGRIFSQFCIGK